MRRGDSESFGDLCSFLGGGVGGFGFGVLGCRGASEQPALGKVYE